MKKNKMNNFKRKKFLTGGRVGSWNENISSELNKDQINKSRAEYEALTNPFVVGTKLFSGLLNTASNIFGDGSNMDGEKSGFTKAISEASEKMLPLIEAGTAKGMFKYGGRIKNKKVEVEGKELAELPNSQVIQYSGNTHEQGGIDTELPVGSEVYSNRIEIDGETIADRKNKRTKIESKFKKLYDNGDSISKNTLNRIKQINSKEDLLERSIQESIQNSKDKYAYGSTVDEYPPSDTFSNYLDDVFSLVELNPFKEFEHNLDSGSPKVNAISSYKKPNISPGSTEIGSINPITSNREAPKIEKNRLGDLLNKTPKLDITAGDALGIAGNIFSGVSPYLNTLRERAGDRTNENFYSNYGDDALKTIDDLSSRLEANKDKQIKRADLLRRTGKESNRLGARGINTLRALDLNSDLQYNKAEQDISVNYENSLYNVLNSKANTELRVDEIRARGEEEADTNNRKDRAAFYLNRGRDLVNLGETITGVGSTINKSKERTMYYNMINQNSPYVSVDTKGNFTIKEGTLDTPEFRSKYPEVFNAQWKTKINPTTKLPFESIDEYIGYKESLELETKNK